MSVMFSERVVGHAIRHLIVQRLRYEHVKNVLRMMTQREYLDVLANRWYFRFFLNRVKTASSSADILTHRHARNFVDRLSRRNSAFHTKLRERTKIYSGHVSNGRRSHRVPGEKGILLFRSKRILEGTTSVLLYEPRKLWRFITLH